MCRGARNLDRQLTRRTLLLRDKEFFQNTQTHGFWAPPTSTFTPEASFNPVTNLGRSVCSFLPPRRPGAGPSVHSLLQPLFVLW